MKMSCDVILRVENVLKSQQKIGRKKYDVAKEIFYLTREFIQSYVLC